MTDTELKAFHKFVEDLVFIGERLLRRDMTNLRPAQADALVQEAAAREKETMDGPWHDMGPDNRRLAIRLNELLSRVPL